ncbi:MAG TPA: hypothetical protein VF832_09445 [Longimicrobiales bacterium]
MDWVHGTRGAAAAARASEARAEPVEGAAPGLAALLEGVSDDHSHAVLDLGAAADPNLRLYSRYARWVRFLDLLGPGGWAGGGSAAASPGHIPPEVQHPYDLVFAWDVLDWLSGDQRRELVRSLAEVSAPRARLHLLTRVEDAVARPLRFTILDVNRVRYEPSAGAALPRSRLLPAEVARLLEPFRVLHAFTLRSGLREYVAVRQGS